MLIIKVYKSNKWLKIISDLYEDFEKIIEEV